MELEFELFIRRAFRVDRCEDPAHLADQGIVDHEENINVVKAIAGYAILIYENRDSESHIYQQALNVIMSAGTIQEILDEIHTVVEHLREHNLWHN